MDDWKRKSIAIDRLLKKNFRSEIPCNAARKSSTKILKDIGCDLKFISAQFFQYILFESIAVSILQIHEYMRVTPALGTTHGNKIVTKLDSRKGACSR